jgi:hypothetical protein
VGNSGRLQTGGSSLARVIDVSFDQLKAGSHDAISRSIALRRCFFAVGARRRGLWKRGSRIPLAGGPRGSADRTVARFGAELLGPRKHHRHQHRSDHSERRSGPQPRLAITGFPPGRAGGSTHAGDATALQARSDLTTAYLSLAGDPCTSDLTGKDLGGLTLLPGVYCFSSEAQLTGTLVLDARFVANAAFIFQIGSKLTTSSGASVRLIDGADPCNVFWQVGSSATVGTAASFSGNILALTSISLSTGASLFGRALARNGAVTLDSNEIASARCAVATGGSDGGTALATCCDGAKLCDGICSDLQTDANNCGACGKHCSASEMCSAGACGRCPATSAQCPGQCANLQGDPFNCGACGHACAASQSCVAGTCGACDGTLCANACVELRTDEANCGACGHACAADECCHAGSCSTRDANNALCKQ